MDSRNDLNVYFTTASEETSCCGASTPRKDKNSCCELQEEDKVVYELEEASISLIQLTDMISLGRGDS